jgi:hypothetical protein
MVKLGKKKHKSDPKPAGLDVNKFNSMIAAAAAIVTCDAECEREKKKEELKKKFKDAQSNLQSAPKQLSLASKRYFEFSNGKPKYEEIFAQELTKQSKSLSGEIVQQFFGGVSKVGESIEKYISDAIDLKIAKELNEVLEMKIVALQNTLYKVINGTVTNDRKFYYGNESIEYLRKWNYGLMILFYTLFIALSASLFLAPNTLPTPAKFAIMVAVSLYPFYILYIAGIISVVYGSVMKILPKNVYKDSNM